MATNQASMARRQRERQRQQRRREKEAKKRERRELARERAAAADEKGPEIDWSAAVRPGQIDLEEEASETEEGRRGRGKQRLGVCAVGADSCRAGS